MDTDKIRLTVYPAIAVHDQTFDDDTFVISIASPEMSYANIQCKNVWKVSFHDVQQEYFLEKGERTIRPLDYELAQHIVRVAFENRDKRHWIIHCEAGISRSPAVALGLAKHIRFSKTVKGLEREFPHYNKYVRKLIEQAGDEQMKRVMKDLIRGE